MSPDKVNAFERKLGVAKQTLIVVLLATSLISSCNTRRTTRDVIAELIQLELVVCNNQDRLNEVRQEVGLKDEIPQEAIPNVQE